MTPCDHAETTEALALGMLPPDEAGRARAHLAICDACRDEHALFEDERDLFAARAPYHAKVAPPPVITPPHPHRFGAAAHHHMKTFVAALACAAAVVCVAKLDRSLEPYAPPPARTASDVASADGEPLACAAPVSGFAFTPTDQLACRSASPRACEDEPLASYAR